MCDRLWCPQELEDAIEAMNTHNGWELDAELKRVLEAVGLGQHIQARVSALSGGQRKRVALASSLLGSPDLLVLDEVGLGAVTQRVIERVPVTPLSAPVTPLSAPVTPLSAPVTPLSAPVTPLSAPVTPLSAAGGSCPPHH